MQSVEDLEVFKLAHRLVLEVYKSTETFPREEQFGLTTQVRKAATSAPSNLVEGASRFSQAEYQSFVSNARGSAGETRYHLLLARDLGYLENAKADWMRDEYSRVVQMLTNLHKSLGKKRAARE
jgi:four helix bundle protein